MAEQYTDRLRSGRTENGAAQGRWATGSPQAEKALKRGRNWLYATGAVSMIAGALAIIIPAAASVTVAILIGWILLVVAAFALAHAWSVRAPGRGLRLFNAVLMALAGLCLIVFPLTGTFTLTFFLAAWFLVTGAINLAAAFSQRDEPGALMLGLHGAVSLLLGILIVADLPSSAGWAIGLLVGVNLIFFAVRCLAAGALIGSALKAPR
jgi:uncharacterized membrane protein HdeD (DUF308 family)